MKKVISLVLVLVLVFSVAFQCTLNSSAIAGVDDVVLIGTIVMELAALGISIYNIKEFCKTDTFKDLCNALGNGLERSVELVVIKGKLFFAIAKYGWDQLVSWVKGHFSGKTETKEIEFEVSEETYPSSLTLRDGTVVPYAEWMEDPFFIYNIGAGIRAITCHGAEPGMNWGTSMIQVWCVGHGTIYRFDLVNGEWSNAWTRNMNYGLTYKGQTGSFFNLDFGSNVHADTENFYLYRTMQRTTANGAIQEDSPPEETPKVEVEHTATVMASSDAEYYPGAVNAATEVIQVGEKVLVEVPDEMVVEDGQGNKTVTTDLQIVGETMESVTPSNVKPRVLTNTGSVAGTIDGVIADTPTLELDATGNAANDITIANKFRLPRSFLEGFPFSIPYSIYVGIQSLVADPQPPVFNIPFVLQRLGISENVNIDLSQWNPVARLSRALLSIVWVAGLAMACNKFIKR